MIGGAHITIGSNDAEADKAFFVNVLKLPSVDVGNGRLIFALPKTDAMVHPSDESDGHELWLMTDDVEAEVASLKKAGVACDAPADQGWGIVSRITLPSGGTLGLYQPKHPRP
ncbi:MAG: VOC family protein [Rhizomicrobium sp.]